ncbi:MAG: serine protease [Gammaproteobacteria bacterium]|nr:serine protease [Gammaproteobacteria bacterium]
MSKPPDQKRRQQKRSSGSGIVVSTTGHILTNHHVVEGCRSLRAVSGAMVEAAGISVRPKSEPPATTATQGPFRGRPLKVLDVDAQNDLALLKSATASSTSGVFRSGRGIRTGEGVVVAGFPLPSLLSTDLNVTTGVVSALAGPGNNRRLIQITAPVQPGNSGGPVLDQFG